MITYKKTKYSDIRRAIPDDVFVQLIQGTLKANGVEIEEETARRVLLSLLTSMAYYLYNEPELYIGENAQSIMNYYKNGGAFSEELEKLVTSFIKGLLEYSTAKEAEVTKEINKIKSSKEQICNNSKKEKK